MCRKGLTAVLVLTICLIAAAAPGAGFDATAYGLRGDYAVLQEESWELKRGEISRVRLIGNGASSFNDDLYLEIASPGGGAYLVQLPGIGGYGVNMCLGHFSSRTRPGIFLSMMDGGSGGRGSFYVVELNGEIADFLFNSETVAQFEATGQFQDDYRATAEVLDTGTRVAFNLGERREQYDEQGLYDPETGKLKKEAALYGVGYSGIAPRDVDGDGVEELEGIVAWRGAINADRIAAFHIVWKYEGNDWKLIRAEVVPEEGVRLLQR